MREREASAGRAHLVNVTTVVNKKGRKSNVNPAAAAGRKREGMRTTTVQRRRFVKGSTSKRTSLSSWSNRNHRACSLVVMSAYV